MAKKSYVAAAGLAAGLMASWTYSAFAQSDEHGHPVGGTGAMDWLQAHFGLIAVILIALIFLAVGLPDLRRLSAMRLWAISSVSFRESVRRRVLWVTPLAMLGIVAVTQLAHPVDEQDAIRQTTKYALFATGLVVVVATLILACTNLPKEIDNRVIYTIVTKPATRLEIVLGKTVGFARTSALILLVMGAFTYLYLQVNASQLQSSIRERLQTLAPTDLSRDTLQHYADEGLLQSRTYARPVNLQLVAEPPKAGDKLVWQTGSSEQNVMFGFALEPALFDNPDANLMIEADVTVRQTRAMTKREISDSAPDTTATTRATTQGVEQWAGQPRVSVTLLDANAFTVLGSQDLLDVNRAQPNTPTGFANAAGIPVAEGGAGQRAGRVKVLISAKAVSERLRQVPPTPDGKRIVNVMITGDTAATRYGYAPDAVRMQVVTPIPSGMPDVKPVARAEERPVFRGRFNAQRAQQLRGDRDLAEAPVAVYAFNSSGLVPEGDSVPFEFRTKIERSDDADSTEAENATHIEFTFRNRKTGATAGPVEITPDTDRPTFFRAPRAAVEGGEFDVLVRARTDGHYVGLRSNSLSVVAASQSFFANLAKSLFILWLLSLLVVFISIFCSTFLSWPIAVVLTLVLLLGRWAVVQIGDATTPQQMATEFFGSKAGGVETRVFTDTVAALNKLMTFTARLLPDLQQFRVTEDIERGVTIPLKSLSDPLIVLVTFGLPILILAYLFLRRKEVAP